MKREVLIGVFIFTFLFLASFAAAACTDSDAVNGNGLNYYTRGIVSFYTQSFTDSCISTTQLREYYCDANGNVSSISFPCPTGYNCTNGACIKTTAPTCTAGWKCYNSNYRGYQNATCGWNSLTYCPSGCLSGMCLTSNPTNPTTPLGTCSETDTGNDIYNFGTITTSSGAKVSDACYDSRYIFEWYCVKNVTYRTLVPCPAGYNCTNGACKAAATSNTLCSVSLIQNLSKYIANGTIATSTTNELSYNVSDWRKSGFILVDSTYFSSEAYWLNINNVRYDSDSGINYTSIYDKISGITQCSDKKAGDNCSIRGVVLQVVSVSYNPRGDDIVKLRILSSKSSFNPYVGSWCINSATRYTQDTFCKKNDSYCANGCSNGVCKGASTTCTAGWKCYSSTTRAYQNSTCGWSYMSSCTNGCENGVCKPSTSIRCGDGVCGAGVEGAVSFVQGMPEYNFPQIYSNATLVFNGRTYQISMGWFGYLDVNNETPQVKLLVNGAYTGLLKKGQSYKLFTGDIIYIKDILVQDYAGGIKRVYFVLGENTISCPGDCKPIVPANSCGNGICSGARSSTLRMTGYPEVSPNVTLLLNGKTYNVSIDFISTSDTGYYPYAILKVNGQLTSPLQERQSYRLPTGEILYVKAVLLQDYAGGIKRVDFTLGEDPYTCRVDCNTSASVCGEGVCEGAVYGQVNVTGYPEVYSNLSLVFNGKTYKISLISFSSNGGNPQVKLSFNGIITEALVVHQSQILPGGEGVFIEGIQYQDYAGGTKKVSFVLGENRDSCYDDCIFGSCTAGWTCYNSTMVGIQGSSCGEWSGSYHCVKGCFNGACIR